MTDSTPSTGTDSAFRGTRLSDAPIGAMPPPEGVRWLRILVWFMRLTAIVWLIRGVMQWGFIIGLEGAGFPDLRLSRMGIVMLCAVLDLVAAVGMWMVSSWGAAVWIVVLFIEGSLPFLLPDLNIPLVEAFITAGFGATYLALVTMARRERLSPYA